MNSGGAGFRPNDRDEREIDLVGCLGACPSTSHVASPSLSPKWFHFVDLRRPESLGKQTQWPEIAGMKRRFVTYPRP